MNTDIRGAQLSTPSGKPLRGLYPILQTPFTPDEMCIRDRPSTWTTSGCGV